MAVWRKCCVCAMQRAQEENKEGGDLYYRANRGCFPVRWTAPEASLDPGFLVPRDPEVPQAPLCCARATATARACECVYVCSALGRERLSHPHFVWHASPRQAMDTMKFDPSTDMWSFGITMIEVDSMP